MTKKTQSKEELLLKLGTLKSRQYPVSRFKRWMISDDDPLWKRPKKDAIVNDFYVAAFEIWRGNLICRTFYVCQCWLSKEKIIQVFEVKRQLAGCTKQLTKRLYNNMGIKVWRYDDYPFYSDKSSARWTERNEGTFNLAITSSYYCSTLNRSWHMLNSEEELFKLLRQTEYKYSGFEYSTFGYHEIFNYLLKYEKHHEIEMVSKMGLDYLLNTCPREIQWKRKGLDFLGIDKRDIKLFRKIKPDSIEDFNGVRDYLYKFNIISSSAYNHLLLVRQLIKDNQYANLKLSKYTLEYFEKQDLSRWIVRDYYRFCEELGLPMNHANKYPDDMKTKHDELQELIKIKRSEKRDQDIIARVNNDLYKYRFTNSSMLITPANSTEDLVNESKELHHCVRSYDRSYAKGETNIFLIRECKEPNRPFFTLELSNDKEILQLRGDHNCAPSEPVIDFVRQWAAKYKFTGAYVGKEGAIHEMG